MGVFRQHASGPVLLGVTATPFRCVCDPWVADCAERLQYARLDAYVRERYIHMKSTFI